jgi:hypothetical protein
MAEKAKISERMEYKTELKNPNYFSFTSNSFHFKCIVVTRTHCTQARIKSPSKSGDTMLSFTLLHASECCDLHKQQYKFIEATEMRFLRDIASHREN